MRALTCECGAADTTRFSVTISPEGGSPFALAYPGTYAVFADLPGSKVFPE